MEFNYCDKKKNSWADIDDFWYFKVAGTTDDSDQARELRKCDENVAKFKIYLQKKYGVCWYSGYTFFNDEDHCPYIYELSSYENSIQEENEAKEQEWLRKEELKWDEIYRQKKEEEQEMSSKLKSGIISQEEFDVWKYEKTIDEWDGYPFE